MVLKVLDRETAGAERALQVPSGWPTAGAPILPLASVRGALDALAQPLPADAASATQLLAAAAAALTHLFVLTSRILDKEPALRAAEMAVLAFEQTNFLQHLPGLLNLDKRGILVVESALRVSVNLTAVPTLAPEGPAAAALRLPRAAFQALVHLLALEARCAGTLGGPRAAATAAAAAPGHAGAPVAAVAATAAASSSVGGAANSASDSESDSRAYSLTPLADRAIKCLMSSCMLDTEQVIAQCAPAVQDSTEMLYLVLRRIACRPERPQPGDAVCERLHLLYGLT